MMSVTYQFTRDEILSLRQNWSHYCSPSLSKLYYYGLLPTVFLLVASTASFGVGIAVLLLVYGGGSIISHYQQRQIYDIVYSEANIAHLLKHITVDIDSEGVVFRHPDYDLSYRWHGISDLSRERGYIQFHTSPIECSHIPVRAFRSEDEAASFYELARFHHLAARETLPISAEVAD
jgi:hypothetical protein